MGVDGEIVVPGHLFLQPLNAAIFKLYNLATFRTYEVVMVFILMYDLKAGSSFTKLLLLCKTTFT